MFVSLVGSLLVMILQNLCTVAAYRPLKELLKQEKVLMRTLLLKSTENGLHMQFCHITIVHLLTILIWLYLYIVCIEK